MGKSKEEKYCEKRIAENKNSGRFKVKKIKCRVFKTDDIYSPLRSKDNIVKKDIYCRKDKKINQVLASMTYAYLFAEDGDNKFAFKYPLVNLESSSIEGILELIKKEIAKHDVHTDHIFIDITTNQLNGRE